MEEGEGQDLDKVLSPKGDAEVIVRPSSTSRIAKNTLFLYFRQILIMLVSLYTVRVVLATLGAEDYGIYNVVGGVVLSFSFLGGTMASATQRFFSFALGEGSRGRLDRTFGTSLIIYAALALTAMAILESAGNWFVCFRLKVPAERFSAARWVFHFTTVAFFFSMMGGPFMAIIIAHEDMQIYACISIVEAVMKLFVVFVLRLFAWDKLKLYAVLLCAVGFVNAAIYVASCMKRYPECRLKKIRWDKGLFCEMFSFTVWTFFGQVTTMTRTQAVTILLNQMFSPVVVAARAIATQVSNCINVFSSNFNTSLYPSIIKSYASGDADSMFRLAFIGCKMTFFLMWVFALPLFMEMDSMLSLWLKKTPEFASLFTRLALIEVLINAVSLPIATVARAPGKMKKYELSLGSIQILIFLADFILLRFFGAPAFIVFVVAALGNALMFVIRLLLVHGMVRFPMRGFASEVMLPVMLVAAMSGIPTFLVDRVLPGGLLSAAASVALGVCLSSSAMFMVGLNDAERKAVLERMKGRLGGGGK